MIVQFVEMRFPDGCSGHKLPSTRRQCRLNGRKLQTIEMFQQVGASATTFAALVLPWTALLAIHALSETIAPRWVQNALILLRN